jgi:hypothetical protein
VFGRRSADATAEHRWAEGAACAPVNGTAGVASEDSTSEVCWVEYSASTLAPLPSRWTVMRPPCWTAAEGCKGPGSGPSVINLLKIVKYKCLE